MDTPPDESPARPGAWTVIELIRWTTADFQKLDLDSPRLDAELLLSHALGCERIDLYLMHDRAPEQERLAEFREMVKRRREREPVAYITGKKVFRDIELAVSPAVMVPRPETELLVDAVISCIRSEKYFSRLSRPRVLDLGTGSGAIALSLAKEMPALDIRASDVSGEALKVAQKNAIALDLAGRVSFLKGDRFEPFKQGEAFDIIVSNPPYIDRDNINSLMPEIKDYEPRLALDGGREGLEFITYILGAAPARLAAGGWLWIEVGDGQAEKAAAKSGRELPHRATIKDYTGIPRILGFERI